MKIVTWNMAFDAFQSGTTLLGNSEGVYPGWLFKRTKVGTESREASTRIRWTEVGSFPPLGHGVQFLARSAGDESILIAWLPGYAWLHEEPQEVEILVSAESESLAPRTFRAVVEAAIRSKQLSGGPICGNVFVGFNA